MNMDTTHSKPLRVNTLAYHWQCYQLQHRIRQILGREGQGRIADALGVSRSYLSDVLSGCATAWPMIARIKAYLDSIEPTDHA